MSRGLFCRILLIVVVVVGILGLSGTIYAQGRSHEALERVRAVQERHTRRLIAMQDIEGTAIGLNQDGQPAVKIFTARRGVAGIPKTLDGVPVEVVVSGRIYALKPPVRAPKAPRALTATAMSESEINLDWKNNRESGVVYNVYCATDSGGPYSRINLQPVASSDFSDSGLAPGTTYYYVVTAVVSTKESGYSNEASAITEGGIVSPPVAPSNLNATAVSSSQINLTWTDNSNNETGFSIEWWNGVSFEEIATVGTNVTAYSDTGLNPLTPYTYRVCAFNSAGYSGYSNGASATTLSGPVTPIDPRDRFERPVPIGVSTGHKDITAGTIGCRVKDLAGNVYALSNNHVYADENRATIGDNILQPGPYDGGVDPDDEIGTLAAFIPINFGMFGLNVVDAAIALSSPADLDNSTPIGPISLGGGYGIPSSTTVTAFVGQYVQKYGRTTSLTTGMVTETNGAFLVRYSRGFAIFYDQIVVGSGGFSAGGDSGSLVVTNDGECNPVGLLFAGSDTTTIINPIDDVLSALGVSIDGE